MALKNNLMILFSSIYFMGQFSEAKIILPELMAKQATSNIRFLSQDGKFTYYQKRSGSLLFSTNYKVQEMLKSNIGTEYTILATAARKKIIILQNSHAHNFYSIRAKEKILIADYGGMTARELGTGISPALHLDDSWLSYYDPFTKILSFENTTNSALKFSIKLNNRLNPYFLPQVVMSDDNTVYYTDLSETGMYGVLEFKRSTSKSEIIYKAPTVSIKAELCLNQDHLILGLFGIRTSKLGSTISSINLPVKDFSKRETLYSSEQNDLGHMVCDFDKSNIAFIKNSSTTSLTSFDIVNLNVSDKKITPLTETNTVSNIINMDGILLTEEKGKYYIVKGDVDYKSLDSLKAKPDAPSGNKLNDVEKDLENE